MLQQPDYLSKIFLMKNKNVSLEIFAHNLRLKAEEKGIQSYQELATALQLNEPNRCKRWYEAKTFPQHKVMVPLMAILGINNYQQFLTEKL